MQTGNGSDESSDIVSQKSFDFASVATLCRTSEGPESDIQDARCGPASRPMPMSASDLHRPWWGGDLSGCLNDRRFCLPKHRQL
jgi:hypothetical protein